MSSEGIVKLRESPPLSRRKRFALERRIDKLETAIMHYEGVQTVNLTVPSCEAYPVHAPVAQRIELGVPNSFQGIPLTYLNDTETLFFQYVTYLSLVVPTGGKMYPYIRKVPTANRVPVRSHKSHRCGLSTPATLEPAVTQILVQTKLNLNNEFAMERKEGRAEDKL